MSKIGAIKGGLRSVFEGLSPKQVKMVQETVQAINHGEEPSAEKLRSLLSYLRNEGSNVKYKDVLPGAQAMPEGLPLRPIQDSDKFHRGSAQTSPASTPPIFTFRNNPEAALDYTQILSAKTPGIVDSFTVDPSKIAAASNRDLYKVLVDEPGLLKAARKEQMDAGEELSSAHDYLYTGAMQRAMKDWGYNAVQQLEDMPSTGAMAEGLIALDKGLLVPRSRHVIGSPEFAKDYEVQGLRAKRLSPDHMLLKPQKKAEGGLINAGNWQDEQRRQRGEHIDDTSAAIARADKVKGALKSTFIGDTPGEMAFNAATLGALPLKGARVGLGGLAAMLAADDAEAAWQKMLQLMYRGRSSKTPIEDARALYMSPQREYAEQYALRRARQQGGDSMVDTYMVDPSLVERRGHNMLPENGRRNMQSSIAYPKAGQYEYMDTLKLNRAMGGLIQMSKK